MVFANIEYLFLLLLLIPYIVWYILKRKKTEATLQISDARVYAHTPKSYKNYLLHAPFILRVIALALIIVVLARPQSTNKWQNSEIEGIDIMLAIDVSTSMLAEDLKPNRLEAAKDVAAEFINGRPNDNIGITLFAGETFTQCPLTVDHAVLLDMIHNIKCGLIEDGTAVGMGVALLTTFYGSFLANYFCNPIGANLKRQCALETGTRTMMLEGILAIQSGVNPRIVEEKLLTYLSAKERLEYINSNTENTEGVA